MTDSKVQLYEWYAFRKNCYWDWEFHLCTSDPRADKLSSFCIREEHPTFPCDLYIWHFHWCSLTHPTGNIASFTLNKSEVKEENKGIFQQMAQTPQLYHCRPKRLTFLHHKITIKLYANGTSANINCSIFSDIKWIVPFFFFWFFFAMYGVDSKHLTCFTNNNLFNQYSHQKLDSSFRYNSGIKSQGLLFQGAKLQNKITD